jgi:hypothetical protein
MVITAELHALSDRSKQRRTLPGDKEYDASLWMRHLATGSGMRDNRSEAPASLPECRVSGALLGGVRAGPASGRPRFLFAGQQVGQSVIAGVFRFSLPSGFLTLAGSALPVNYLS